MLTTQLLILIHVLAMAAFFGVQFGMLYMLLPVAERAPDEAGRRAILIEGFRFYNPFSLALLGVLVITGAMRLTDLKAALAVNYFAAIGRILSLKLSGFPADLSSEPT